jgi:hypothetical protein
MVSSTQLGDKVCDLVCMNDPCNYDSYDRIPSCLATCEGLGCAIHYLADGICQDCIS